MMTSRFFPGMLVALLAAGPALGHAAELAAAGAGVEQDLAGARVTVPLTASAASTFPAPDTWGTTEESVVTLLGTAFNPIDSGTTFSQYQAKLYRIGGAVPYFDSGVTLPDGAVITSMELEGCDENPAASISALFVSGVATTDTLLLLGQISTTDLEEVGCVLRATPVVPTWSVVDNSAYRYIMRIGITGANFQTRIGAVRIRYRLQVSPAPGNATFTDVQVGHPLHQFVEALAASGITAGCGGGNFCPNDPITRGQMAVFLAKALGLHWAN